jgi:hypothetical protein
MILSFSKKYSRNTMVYMKKEREYMLKGMHKKRRKNKET